MPELERIGDFTLQWGESLRWDDRSERLYFVDCAAQTLHWLEGAAPPLQTLQLSSLPTGIALGEDGRLVIALGDGLHVVDAAAGSTELLTPYPEELGDRANDAAADLDGNLVTGTLNVAPGPGSYWWYSATEGWRQLDDGIGNANGPVVFERDGAQTLCFADTLAGKIYSYEYDGRAGRVGEREVYTDVSDLGGMPDGACVDAEGGIWSCIFGAGKIARFTDAGMDRVVEAGSQLPSDLAFGGPDLDRLFFVSLSMGGAGAAGGPSTAGALMEVRDTGLTGRPEPRFRI